MTLPNIRDARRVRLGAALRAPLPTVADLGRVRLGAALRAPLPAVAKARLGAALTHR